MCASIKVRQVIKLLLLISSCPQNMHASKTIMKSSPNCAYFLMLGMFYKKIIIKQCQLFRIIVAICPHHAGCKTKFASCVNSQQSRVVTVLDKLYT